MSDEFELDPLTALAIRHGTDKWGPHFYTPIYHELFSHLRDKPVRLLEIGVGGYGFRTIGGASLAMWADYFPNGHIVGIDIAEKEIDWGSRVTFRQGSQTDAEFLQKLAIDHGPFDIVIDDGSHLPKEVAITFHILFPTLAERALYVVEDTQTAFWPKFGGSPITGSETFALAHEILKAVNHAEIQIVAPDWQPPAYASAIRSLRAFHNLLVIEKGDNRHPSAARYDIENPLVTRAIASIEQELTRSATPGPGMTLALMRLIAGQNHEALEIIDTALVSWPDNMRLLEMAATVAGAIGDAAKQIAYLKRAIHLAPSDTAFRQWLARAEKDAPWHS